MDIHDRRGAGTSQGKGLSVPSKKTSTSVTNLGEEGLGGTEDPRSGGLGFIVVEGRPGHVRPTRPVTGPPSGSGTFRPPTPTPTRPL